jgi:NAD+ kinase
MSPCRVVVLTHARPAETATALAELLQVARSLGAVLVFDHDEAEKHGVAAGDGIVISETSTPADADLCVVLGGDGTILRALRAYVFTSVPVFAVNFGEIGFLSTVDREHCTEGFQQALRGETDVLTLPAIGVDHGAPDTYAINDVAIHRKVGERVAQLAFAVDGITVANVRCDGLVVASPAGSTGYNLANGGPVMAWGVEGLVVSYLAPHSLTARPLVVAPNDPLTVHNRSPSPLEVTIDGRPAGELAAGESMGLRFVADAACLAQPPNSSFYRRLQEKFGRLSR